MKKLFIYITTFLMIITGVLSTPVICHGEETSGATAGEEEQIPVKVIGSEGAPPVYADVLRDGTYDVAVESSSSMFRIVKARLTVENGEMSAVMTMGGKGYLKVFMGTGEEAAAAAEADYIPFSEDEEGAHTFEIPVTALNQSLECTAFSKKKEKWYDRQLYFEAASLPEEAWQKKAADMDLEDGEYEIEATLSGGTGRAEIASPARLMVKEKKGTVLIEWSSSNYDYMIVGGEKYLPVNTSGNSAFEIPAEALDEAFAVTANTTAMSEPHEIEYTLTLHSDSIKREGSALPWTFIAGMAVLAAVIAAFAVIHKKKEV